MLSRINRKREAQQNETDRQHRIASGNSRNYSASERMPAQNELPDLSGLGAITAISREDGSGTKAEFENLIHRRKMLLIQKRIPRKI